MSLKKNAASVAVVRFTGREPQILLIRRRGDLPADRWPGVWELPGGNESTDHHSGYAARRALVEETGIVPEGAWTHLGAVDYPTHIGHTYIVVAQGAEVLALDPETHDDSIWMNHIEYAALVRGENPGWCSGPVRWSDVSFVFAAFEHAARMVP